MLLDNQFVFQPFWDALNHPGPDGSSPTYWRDEFDDARQRTHRALAAQDTERVLYEVFMRLYTLRNQLMHGGATWNSSVNRAQVRDGRSLLARMLLVMLGVMMSNPASFQGRPFYGRNFSADPDARNPQRPANVQPAAHRPMRSTSPVAP